MIPVRKILLCMVLLSTPASWAETPPNVVKGGDTHVNAIAGKVETNRLRIGAIYLKTHSNISQADLIERLPFQIGDEFHETDVVAAEQNLLSHGGFERVTSSTEVFGEKISVTFDLIPIKKIGDMEFSDGSIIDEKRLRRVARLSIGEPFKEERVAQAEERLKIVYRDEGYADPKVEVKISPRPGGSDLKLRFKISPGELLEIRGVDIQNDLSPNVQKIIEPELSRSIGDDASKENLKRLSQRVLFHLRSEGYLQAAVRSRGYKRVGDGNTGPDQSKLTLDPLAANAQLIVTPRQPVQFRFDGNTVFSPEELLRPLKLESRTVPFSSNAVENLRRGILQMYQEQGYFFAEVQSSESSSNEGHEQPTANIDQKSGVKKAVDFISTIGNKAISPFRRSRKKREEELERAIFTLSIDEGSQWKIRDVNFVGEHSEVEDELRKGMLTHQRLGWRTLFARDSVLQNDVLAADLVRIEERLHHDGYLNAHAKFELHSYQESHEIDVTIALDLGEKTLIKTVDYSIEPNNDQMSDFLKATVTTGSLHGKPWSDETIQSEKDRIQSALSKDGFDDAEVVVESDITQEKVAYVIHPHRQLRVGKILVNGNLNTHNEPILRELSLKSGDLLNPEELNRAQRNLYRTGNYRSVSTETVVPATRALGDADARDILITVDERDTGKFGFGTAFNTEDGLRLTSELGQQNINGSGDSVVAGADIFLRTGSQLLDAGRARAEYRRPHFLDSENTLIAESFFQHDVEVVKSYSFDRLGVSPYIRREIGEHLLFDFGYMAFHEHLYDVEPDVIASPDDTGSRTYSLIRSQLQLDHRDDPYNPRNGYFSSLETRFATAVLGSDVDMAAASGQIAGYVPLFSDLVWATSLRASIARGFGDTDVVPISQRFFLGGRNSLRGFSRNQIGPRGTALNIAGGDTSVLANTEFQFDFSDNVVGVLFADVGQSFLVDAGEFEGDTQSITHLRFSPGLGIRYRTPIGPLSAEYGFATEREFGERPGRIIIGIGSAF